MSNSAKQSSTDVRGFMEAVRSRDGTEEGDVVGVERESPGDTEQDAKPAKPAKPAKQSLSPNPDPDPVAQERVHAGPEQNPNIPGEGEGGTVENLDSPGEQGEGGTVENLDTIASLRRLVEELQESLAGTQDDLAAALGGDVPAGHLRVTLLVRPHPPTNPALSRERHLTQVLRAQDEGYWHRRLTWSRQNHAYKDPDIEVVNIVVTPPDGPKEGAPVAKVSEVDFAPKSPHSAVQELLGGSGEPLPARAQFAELGAPGQIEGGPSPFEMEMQYLRARLEALESSKVGDDPAETPHPPHFTPGSLLTPEEAEEQLSRAESRYVETQSQYGSGNVSREDLHRAHKELQEARRALREAKGGGPKIGHMPRSRTPVTGTIKGRMTKGAWAAVAQGKVAQVPDSEVPSDG